MVWEVEDGALEGVAGGVFEVLGEEELAALRGVSEWDGRWGTWDKLTAA